MFKNGFLLCIGWEVGKLTVNTLEGVLIGFMTSITNKDKNMLEYMSNTLSLEDRKRLKRKYHLNVDVSEPEPKEEIVNKIGF